MRDNYLVLFSPASALAFLQPREVIFLWDTGRGGGARINSAVPRERSATKLPNTGAEVWSWQHKSLQSLLG